VPIGDSKFCLWTGYKGEPDNEGGLMTRLHDGHPRNRGSITGRGNKFVPTQQRRPDRLLEPTRLRNQWTQQGFFFGEGVSSRSRKLTNHSMRPLN